MFNIKEAIDQYFDRLQFILGSEAWGNKTKEVHCSLLSLKMIIFFSVIPPSSQVWTIHIKIGLLTSLAVQERRSLFCWRLQRAKEVGSNSPWLVISILNLPHGQMKFFFWWGKGDSDNTTNCIQRSPNIFFGR